MFFVETRQSVTKKKKLVVFELPIMFTGEVVTSKTV